jgi:hypothetical protein
VVKDIAKVHDPHLNFDVIILGFLLLVFPLSSDMI